MKTTKQFISPQLAQVYLNKNVANRTVSRRLVEQYARDMKSGQWQLTHQGILIGRDGVLIDGQHRLLAIVASGIGQWMMVSEDESFISALNLKGDTGLRRSNAVVLGISNQLAAIASYALRVSQNINMASASDIEPYVEIYRVPFYALTNGTKFTKGGITKAAVHLAATSRILLGEDIQYIRQMYTCMAHDRFTELSPYVASFYKQVVVDRLHFQESELLARAIRAFDVLSSDKSKMQIKDEATAFDEAKSIVMAALKNSNKLPLAA